MSARALHPPSPGRKGLTWQDAPDANMPDGGISLCLWQQHENYSNYTGYRFTSIIIFSYVLLQCIIPCGPGHGAIDTGTAHDSRKERVRVVLERRERAVGSYYHRYLSNVTKSRRFTSRRNKKTIISRTIVLIHNTWMKYIFTDKIHINSKYTRYKITIYQVINNDKKNTSTAMLIQQLWN